jgi:hypothetical protein
LFINHDFSWVLGIIIYLCRNLVSHKKLLKGNPVQIRNRPAAVSSAPKFLKNISTVFKEWEGFQKWSKSEDLPDNNRLTLSWNKA